MNDLSRRYFIRTLSAAVAAQRLGRRGFAFPLAQDKGTSQAGGEALAELTLRQASEKIRSKTVTPTELTQACLTRIRSQNPRLNAFIEVLETPALAQARMLDAEQQAGRLRSPLHGIPIALKDNMDTAGIRTTAGSAVYDDRVPTTDAEVTRRLRDSGAILIGKANMDEFAFGPSYFGNVLNPWAADRQTGGSSSGSSAAVAADLCYGALGTDTSCSVRTPASYCGVVGLKPTYGLVSIRGIVPLVVSLDHCGPIARTVEDTAMLLNVLAGYDRLDITSVEHAKEDYVAGMHQPVSGFRLGIARDPYFDRLDPEVAAAMEEAIAVLSRLTSSTVDIALPPTHGFGFELYSEASAYHEKLFRENAGRYMAETRKELETGWGKNQNDYIRTVWDLQLLRRTIDDVFTSIDLVVLPTMRQLPGKIDAPPKPRDIHRASGPEDDPGMWMDCVENDEPFNIYGIPAITIPCGFSAGGLPIGMMIAGPHFSEGKIFALGHAYQTKTEWWKRRPAQS